MVGISNYFLPFIYPVFIYTPWYGSMTLEYRAAWKKGRKLPAAPLRVCGFLSSSSTAATVLMLSKVVCIFGLLLLYCYYYVLLYYALTKPRLLGICTDAEKMFSSIDQLI